MSSFLDKYPDILEVKEVADILRVSKATVYRMYDNRRLDGPRTGEKKGGIRILRSSLEALIFAKDKQETTLVPARRRRRSATCNYTLKYLRVPLENPKSEK